MIKITLVLLKNVQVIYNIELISRINKNIVMPKIFCVFLDLIPRLMFRVLVMG